MNQKAIILAAGIGSRLSPITKDIPKSLVNVAGRCILEYQLDGYLKAGIKESDIIIATGYKSKYIEDYVQIRHPSVRIIENRDYLVTNNMYSLFMALKFIKDENFSSLLINNADCLYDSELINMIVKSNYKNVVACKRNLYIEESMKVTCLEEGLINDISKTIDKTKAYGISLDLYKFDYKTTIKLYDIIFEIIVNNKDLNQWTECAFPKLFSICDVFPVDTMKLNWVEVDNNEDLSLADSLFSKFDIKKKKAMICDLDGTLYIGDKSILPAVEYINNNVEAFDIVFLTNNTSRIPESHAIKLNSIGINARKEQIVTPFDSIIEKIRNLNIKSVYLVSTNEVKNYFKANLPDVCFEFDSDNNQLILLTYDTQLTYEKLKNICNLINNNSGILYWASHPDVFCPTEKGPIPDIGSFIVLIKTTTGRQPELIIGKPQTAILDSIKKKYKDSEIFYVGDRLYTDMAMAKKASIDFVCVLSGETTRLELAKINDANLYPELVIPDLSYLS